MNVLIKSLEFCLLTAVVSMPLDIRLEPDRCSFSCSKFSMAV